MVGQLSLRLGTVVAIGCGVSALGIACRRKCIIPHFFRHLTGSLSQPKSAEATIATFLADEVTPSPQAQSQVVAAPEVSETGISSSQAAAETASEDDLHTAVSESKPSFEAGEAAEAAEELSDAAARIEAHSTVPPQGADVAGEEHDSNTCSEVAGDSCRQTAVDADPKQQRKAKKRKSKGKSREVPKCTEYDAAALKAKEAKAEKAAAELLQQEEKEKAAKTKAATKAQKAKKGSTQRKASPPSPGGPECIADVPPAAEDAGLLNRHGDLGADDTVGTRDGAGPLGSVEAAAGLNQLRCDWEELIEQAARCKDATLQPSMLDSVSQMLQRCRDAGISVKYGSKVLKRLQAVGPVREALEAALAAEVITYEKLEAALTAAKGCRCLLQDDLVQLAEAVMGSLKDQADLLEEQQAQQQQAQQQAELQQPRQQQRRQAGQQVQMHEPAGRAVLMVEPLTYPGTPATAHQSTAESRPARQSAQQSSAASTISSMSTAAAASTSHTGRQLNVLCSTSRQMTASAAPGRQDQGRPCGGVGLMNLGNSCYQNSLIQSLNCCADLVQPLLCAAKQIQSAAGAHERQRQPTAAVGPALSGLLTEMQSAEQHSHSNQSVIIPWKFRQAMESIDERWGDDTTQHDSLDFLQSLLAQLQAETNRLKQTPQYKELTRTGTEAEQADEAITNARSWHDSPVDDVFGGFLQSTVTCSHCHHQSHCFDSFLNLAVPIPASKDVSLQDCLLAFTEDEILTGSEQIRCSACELTCDATKRLRVYSYPKLLVLSIKRFKNGETGFGGSWSGELRHVSSKNQTPVKIDANVPLDLSPCCSSIGLKAAAGKGHAKPRYQLQAMSQHFGGLGCGHYTAQGRSVVDGQWYRYNDHEATAGSCPSGASSSAYVLFYRLLDA